MSPKLNQISTLFPDNSVKSDKALLLNAECLSTMAGIPDGSLDLILTDLPYGVSQNKWDAVIPFEDMWREFNRISKPNAAIVLTATQPFSSLLVGSNLKDFKYEMIWEKTISSNQLNVKHQPLRSHESILVFYRKKPTYNEQRTEGEPYSINREINFKGDGYGQQVPNSKVNTGYRHAKSVLKVPNPRIKGGHPTQKPVPLMEYLIATFSNKGDLVFDCCMGSGTTGEAALNLEREFLGIERDASYFKRCVERLVP